MASFLGGTTNDFIGISKEGLEELKNQISTYIDDVRSVIFQFNAYAKTTETFKGTSIENALSEFFIEAKQGLIDYVFKLEKEKERAEKALAEWEAGEKGVSQTVTSSTESIRSEANAFTLD